MLLVNVAGEVAAASLLLVEPFFSVVALPCACLGEDNEERVVTMVARQKRLVRERERGREREEGRRRFSDTTTQSDERIKAYVLLLSRHSS